MRFVLPLVASALYVTIFVTTFSFFNVLNVYSGSIAFGIWFVTLGALYATRK